MTHKKKVAKTHKKHMNQKIYFSCLGDKICHEGEKYRITNKKFLKEMKE